MTYGSLQQGRQFHGPRVALHITDLAAEPRALLGFAPCPECGQMVNIDPGFVPECWSCRLKFHKTRPSTLQRSVVWVLEGETAQADRSEESEEWVCSACGAVTAFDIPKCADCGHLRGEAGS